MNQQKSIYLLIGIIVALSVLSFFANHRRAAIIDAPPRAVGVGAAYLYRFEDFPAERYGGTVADVDLSTAPGAKKFSTIITEAVRGGINFAGRYAVAEWGCGTSCQDHAIIDLATGRIIRFGLVSALGVERAADSRLIVVNPPERIAELAADARPENLATDYYELRDGALMFIGKQNPGEAGSAPCAQVVTEAKNPTTGKMEEFGSPCTVPFGWEVAR